MVLINLHRNLHEKSSFLSEIMFIRINPYLCHLLTRYQSTIFPNHKSCVRKKGVPERQTPFLCDIGYLLEVFSAEVLDVGHTLQCHYRGLHCHVLHRCLNTNLFGLGSLRITLLNVVDHEYHCTRISLYRG